VLIGRPHIMCAACRGYYADSGWEDGLPRWALAKERGEESGIWRFHKPPHTYSVRPYHLAFGNPGS